MSMIEEIRKKCIEANDSIRHRSYYGGMDSIRLADILLAINYSEKNWDYEDYGTTLELQAHQDHVELATNEQGYACWNLKKDNLHSQSKETIKFIHNLLTDNKK